MKKIFPIAVSVCLVLLVVWQVLAKQTNYYLVSVAVLILSMIPFLASFEREEHSAREITLIAGMIALAVVSRAVFYLVPQIKPIAAVVGVSGACLGAKRGYLVGCFSMFISNFIFGQGVWTPFQMVAMGIVGLVFGVIFSKIKITKVNLAATGFLTVAVFYALIVDLSSVLFFSTDLDIKSILAVYGAAVPFNMLFAFVTAIFLFAFGVPFTKKIERINMKYGIYRKNV